MNVRVIINSLLLSVLFINVNGQQIDSSGGEIIIADSIAIVGGELDTVVGADTMTLVDTITGPVAEAAINNGEIKLSDDTLDAPVKYIADDSIVYDIVNMKVHLYGNAVAEYQQIRLKADHIVYDWAEGTLSGEMNTDSLGEPIGFINFNDGQKDYRARRIAYNFKTGKGKVYQAKTEEGGGYLHVDETKKNERDEWYAKHGSYTTCNLDEPHFHLHSTKMKIVPDKVMVTGPANLVIADVPTPLYLPFGIFPVKKGQRSGIIMPSNYGEDFARGFFVQGMGYYFGINDYADLALTGDLYTNGSWALRSASNYKLRYKFAGNLFASFGRNRLVEREAPNSGFSNDFRVNWRHSQDPKARPNSRFSANVNFGTSLYDRNFSNSQERVTNSQFSSTVSYSKSWLGRPLTFSTNLRHDQSLVTGRVTLTLPSVTFGVSRIQPFKAKVASSKRKWYETIGFSYTFQGDNRISGTDSTFFTRQTFEDASYGIRHTLPISSNIKLFKHFTLTPSFNYSENWYLQTIRKQWDPSLIIETDSNGYATDITFGQVVTDTVFGFESARDFNFSTSLSTRIYSMATFKGKIKAIRLVTNPTLSFTYRPDFGTDFWGYYRDVQESYEEDDLQRYSIFDHTIFGGPGEGLRAALSLNINNNLEMKTFSKKDTVDYEKKIKLLESFSFRGSYNFAADSLNMSVISINAFTTLFNKLRVNFSTTLDPYTVNEDNRRINTFVWEQDKRFTRLTRASLALGSGFRSKKATQPQPTVGTTEEQEEVLNNLDNYYNFNIPWSFNFDYNISLSRGVPGNPDTLVVAANSVRFDLDINITRNWKLTLASGYDFNSKEIVYTTMNVIRDLHCWEMSFNFSPFPRELQFYGITLQPKSPVLQDMKLNKKQDRFNNEFF